MIKRQIVWRLYNVVCNYSPNKNTGRYFLNTISYLSVYLLLLSQFCPQQFSMISIVSFMGQWPWLVALSTWIREITDCVDCLFVFLQNAHVLQAVLILMKELDRDSLEILDTAIRKRLEDLWSASVCLNALGQETSIAYKEREKNWNSDWEFKQCWTLKEYWDKKSFCFMCRNEPDGP